MNIAQQKILMNIFINRNRTFLPTNKTQNFTQIFMDAPLANGHHVAESRFHRPHKSPYIECHLEQYMSMNRGH